MTKPKNTRTAAQEEARRNAWAAGADAFAVDTDAPDTQPSPPPLMKAQPMRICNASMFEGDYFTGYGEVPQPLRAGATQAMRLPSRGIGA